MRIVLGFLKNGVIKFEKCYKATGTYHSLIRPRHYILSKSYYLAVFCFFFFFAPINTKYSIASTAIVTNPKPTS